MAVKTLSWFRSGQENKVMSNRQKMICPNCGIEMNHHATKIDYSHDVDVDETISSDRDEMGHAIEVHTCPGCGNTQSRPAVA
jgi:ribosomal protein S27AE